MRLFLAVLGGLLCVSLSACSGESSDASPVSSSSASSSPQTSASPPASTPSAPAQTDSSPDTDSQTVADRLRDASLSAQVKQALVQQKALRVFDFDPEVSNGRLVVRGDVNTRDQHRLVTRVARSVRGIEAVESRVTVAGAPVLADAPATSQPDKASADRAASAAAYYTVRKGDTLWNIAREYRASVSQIRELNDLSGGGLQPGQRIRVR